MAPEDAVERALRASPSAADADGIDDANPDA
jgi:hypothetical protein